MRDNALTVKLTEAAALTLFDEQGIFHPQFELFAKTDDLTSFVSKCEKLVVKANIPIGGKKKSGLVKICSSQDLKKTIEEIIEAVNNMDLGKSEEAVVVEEYIEHKDEYFLSLKAIREGVQVIFSESGGIEVESNWEKIKTLIIPTEQLIDRSWDWGEIFINKEIKQFATCLVDFFLDQDASYLEVNPFTLVNNQAIPLGIVLDVDDSAGFRHESWLELKGVGFESKKSDREKIISQIDSEIKGSVKLVEVPVENPDSSSNRTALMAAGAGAALYLADAILENGYKLANYAEFSGNPPSFAITELTKQVCYIPGIKNLVIASGIANFTPVKPNFAAIIEGLKQSPAAKSLYIVVRRCGPGEEEGIKMMRDFAAEFNLNIKVFGREVGMTEIVKNLNNV